MVIKPATLIGWHRQILRRHWTFKHRRRPARPRIGRNAEKLILQIAGENPHWGYTKIAGEVRKLGYSTIGRSTVERILKRHGLAPRPHHNGLTWADFLGHYGPFVWARDLLTVTTATLRTCHVLFFIEISTRRIVYWHMSEHPDGNWVAQQFRNLSIVQEQLPRHLIHDRDSKFTAYADDLLHPMGTQPVLLPPRRPDLNGHVERWIRTVRSECLDRVIILNEGHLRWAIGKFVRYYNARRPHRSPGPRPPEGPVDETTARQVCRHRLLGRLINDYCRRAA